MRKGLGFKINLQLFADPIVDEKDKNKPIVPIVDKPIVPIVDENELRGKIEKEIRDKIEKEKEEALQKAEFEKLKNALDKTEKNVEDSKNITSEKYNELLIKHTETVEMMKVYMKSLEIEKQEKEFEKFKNEVGKKVSDNAPLKALVDSYITQGTIKSMDDYNRIVAPHEAFYKQLKEQQDIISNYGKDPMRDQALDKRVDSTSKTKNKSTDLDKLLKDVDKKFGIISK